ncbi:tripeptidyl peptidase A [Mycena filopes]|nr:tripeptidyl peptidase A [Mycena filopes]
MSCSTTGDSSRMRMMFPALLCLLAAFAAVPAHSASLVKHSLPAVPSGWSALEEAELSPSRGLNLRIGLAQDQFPHLEAVLRNTSDPTHSSYGQHLSKDQVHALSKPSEDTLELVTEWLAAHNATSVKWSLSQDSVSAVVPVSVAEDMLSTRFRIFEHAKSGTQLVRTLSYSLPLALAPHINFVHPTTAFFDPTRHGLGKVVSEKEAIASRLDKRPVQLNQSDFKSCVDIVDPPCVRKLFNIGNYTADPAAAKGSNHIGVAGYLDIWARPDSFKLYINDYIPESIGSNFTLDIVNITGPFTVNSFSDEGNLDTQLAIQVAYPIPITYYTTNSVPPYIPDQNQDGEQPGVNEPYLDFIDYLLGLEDPPTVITTSYGDDEQTVPKDYADAVCQGFAKLGARGVSVLFSSGDQGLGTDDLPTCIANTGNNASTFLPVFPASCPYVTTVGETVGLPQTASFASGAGFSSYFKRPWYQDAAVSSYLAGQQETALQSSMYDHHGRAYPDIVCPGGGAFFDYFFGRWDIGGGTSAAVPTAASIVALLNDWRLRNGKPTMGFLNPFLYGVGSSGMVDMTEGFVEGCEQPGFNATVGWDPATGLGYFDFHKLQKLSLL